MKRQTISALNAEQLRLSGSKALTTVLDAIGKKDAVRVYLGGGMRKTPREYWLAAIKAAQALRELDFEVWSPHEEELALGFRPEFDEHKPLKEYMKVDLPQLLSSDMLVLLPQWYMSEGTLLEVYVAMKCDIPVIQLEELVDRYERVPEQGTRD